ncbi:hypothetical protein M942_08445 [Enterobacter ludwigii]|jgi:hypothetical protein|uniref:hypothetical protein n=1 Tax=Enterobacter ludwigii TaxID=299767 RepID=UPI0003D7B409|nr:hypothetical protein [Enterobacter ludwigii]AHE72764.1 hypothetical protein M942_08445 [Enterobacter ludwigii]
MKMPIDMLHEILAQVSEGNTLLEMIYKNTEEMNEETDCAIACLIRSFDKTREMTCAYIEELAQNNATHPQAGNSSDISDDIFHAAVTAEKLRELAHVYSETYFTGDDNSDPSCIIASVIFDYAIKIDVELKSIEAKFS